MTAQKSLKEIRSELRAAGADTAELQNLRLGKKRIATTRKKKPSAVRAVLDSEKAGGGAAPEAEEPLQARLAQFPLPADGESLPALHDLGGIEPEELARLREQDELGRLEAQGAEASTARDAALQAITRALTAINDARAQAKAWVQLTHAAATAGSNGPLAANRHAPDSADLRVRHYVHAKLSPEVDALAASVLSELARFQRRAREQDPTLRTYAKHKRLVMGMQEVSRGAKRGKLHGLVVAPNLTPSPSEGGLDEVVTGLIATCQSKGVPVIFALSRNRLGKALGASTRQGVVGVVSVQGQEQQWRQLVELGSKQRAAWVTEQLAFAPALDELTEEEEEEEEQGSERAASEDAAGAERHDGSP